MIEKPIQVKAATIASPAPIVSFGAGLDERGDYNIAPDAFSYGKNMMVNSANNATKRLSTKKWLPDSVGFNGEAATIYWEGEIYFFIADDGKIKYCQENDTEWTDCGGTNSITTDADVITTFLRTNDWLLCLNGVDEMPFIDLATFDMVQFTHVNDPGSTLTATPTGITGTGPFNVYYGITYNSDGGGETAVGPILTKPVSKSRSTWVAATEYLTVAFNDTPPVGATSRNLYAAIALQGTTPVASDLAMLKPNIAIADTSFVDNGSIPFDISYNTAPDTNTTAGIKAKYGLMVDNIPVLYGDPDNPYDIYFGALTDEGVSFGSNNGAQRLPLMKGTNYYPTKVIGFRNNQNIPNLFALFSGTEGVSKQKIISQKTLTYGNETLNYWAADDMNSGAPPVYSSYGVVSSLNQLVFPASGGFIAIKTEQDLQNVLSPDIVSPPIERTYDTIKSTDFNKIVGTAWKKLMAFTIPSRGYNYNNQIAVYDLTNKQKPKWYIWDLTANWIGTVSPPNRDSFMYIRQGNKFFKLQDTYVAEDEDSTGASEPFAMTLESASVPYSPARNSYFAGTQGVVYLAGFIGSVDVTFSYMTKKGRIKTKTKTFTNGSHTRNLLGGWANPRLLYRSFNNRLINWSTPMPTSGAQNNTSKIVKRCRVRLPNPVHSEYKVKVSSNLSNTSFDVVNAAIEGVNIGPIGDIV